MKDKIKSLVCISCIIFGFLFVVGTAGALEHNNIGYLQCFIQCLIGFGVMWLGFSRNREEN